MKKKERYENVIPDILVLLFFVNFNIKYFSN